MMVDTGVEAQWPRLKRGIEEHGSITDVTHVLITHWDQDHIRNVKEFTGAITVSGAGTSRIGARSFGRASDMPFRDFIDPDCLRLRPLQQAGR